MTAEIQVVGEIFDDIKSRVAGENVVFLPEGSIVTMDYRPERTRIWYDKETRIVTRVTKG